MWCRTWDKTVENMFPSSLVILLAEDDLGHAHLVRRSLERAGIRNRLVHVPDGQQALDYVQRKGSYATREADGPLLLVLDINMPGIDGIEVLRQIKSDEKTANIPVIMLTTTDDPREVTRCYELGCSIYIAKPVASQGFVKAIQRLGLFLQVVVVPPEDQ